MGEIGDFDMATGLPDRNTTDTYHFPQNRAMWVATCVLAPIAFAEWVYYTRLIRPFLCTKERSLGRFKFIVQATYFSATVAAWLERPLEFIVMMGKFDS